LPLAEANGSKSSAVDHQQSIRSISSAANQQQEIWTEYRNIKGVECY
jgi:hypothetical protein